MQLTWLCPARGARGAVDVVIGETDYQGFAILYLERARRLSVKLYGASTREPRLRILGPFGWDWESPEEHTDPPSLPPSLALTLACQAGLQVWGQSGNREEQGSGSGLRCVTGTQTPTPSPTARSLPVSDSALSAFEQAVQRANLTEDHIFFFPKYGEWSPWAGLGLPALCAPPPTLTPPWAPRFL